MKRLLLIFVCFAAIPAISQAQHGKATHAVAKPKAKLENPAATTVPAVASDSIKVKVKGYQPPKFPGGEKKMHEFVAQNLQYPAKAKESGLEGEVFVKVVVKKDGSIGTPKVVSGLDKECDREAIRVVAMMPKWTPGLRDDVPIEVGYTIPVRFMVQ